MTRVTRQQLSASVSCGASPVSINHLWRLDLAGRSCVGSIARGGEPRPALVPCASRKCAAPFFCRDMWSVFTGSLLAAVGCGCWFSHRGLESKNGRRTKAGGRLLFALRRLRRQAAAVAAAADAIMSGRSGFVRLLEIGVGFVGVEFVCFTRVSAAPEAPAVW